MKIGTVVLALLALGLSDIPAFAQKKCRGSCSYSKSVCLQQTRDNEGICGAAFTRCMATGVWDVSGQRRRAYFENRCRR
jgi:hypothetical protein